MRADNEVWEEVTEVVDSEDPNALPSITVRKFMQIRGKVYLSESKTFCMSLSDENG